MEKKVRYSYLPEQFGNPEPILEAIKDVVMKGDYTLGRATAKFEKEFAELLGVKHAFGVGSGTDALKVGLKAVGVGIGDEVITAANTFIATAGAINELGAKPVFVDCNDSFCMDVDKVEAAITPKTKAIMPVQITGDITDMNKLMAIAKKHNLKVVEDSCQGILASLDGKNAGTWGDAAGFSLHPQKNLNVWGDGGMIVTNSDEVAAKIKLLRNHGLKNRDEVEIMGFNTRLDSVQAAVGSWLIKQVHDITNKRIENAKYYDDAFSKIKELKLPCRREGVKRVYHLYMVFAERRDELYQYCLDRGISVKIHYPIPLYLQKALSFLGHKKGDFPVSDRHAETIISFPADQHMTKEQLDYVIETVRSFYEK
jgi:dTDP-4-amino-4,6-dideoxygalactose transaminase